MSDLDLQTAGIRDPRLAAHAASALPAWLWAADGSRVLWMNAAAAATSGPPAGEPTDDDSRAQIVQLARQLAPDSTSRLEQLRGFGAAPGELRNYACTRLALDSVAAVLIAAVEPIGRPLAHVRRLSFLTERLTAPAAAFDAKGDLLSWNDGAESFLDGKLTLAGLGLEPERQLALARGAATAIRGENGITLYRLGDEGDFSLMALIGPADSISAQPSVDETRTANEQAAAAQPAGIATDAPPPAAAENIVDETFADKILVDEDEAAPAAEPLPVVGTASGAEAAAADADGVVDEAFADEILVDEDEGETETTDSLAVIRTRPLRFSWVMTVGGRFALGPDEFVRLIGPHTSAAFGRPWREIADALHLDPMNAFAKAVATHKAFSGVVVQWPFDGADTRLPVTLAGEPMRDRAGDFAGYRGFGICNDLSRLAELAEMRRAEEQTASTTTASTAMAAPDEPFIVRETQSHQPLPTEANSPDPEPDILTTENVVPFRPAQDVRAETRTELKPDLQIEPQPPALSPGENHAFDEIARRLTARLDQATHGLHRDLPDELIAAEESMSNEASAEFREAAAAPWLATAAEPPRGASRRDLPILDRVPTGILIYSLDKLLYANEAFLHHAGFDSLQALDNAGGLDALFVEPVRSAAKSTTKGGTLLTIAGRAGGTPVEARLFSIAWNDDSAMALILSPEKTTMADTAANPSVSVTSASTDDDELHAILDTATDGIVMFERSGEITSCNRSAEALFGHNAADLVKQNLADLFAPESQRAVLDYFESVDGEGAPSVSDHGREVLARVRGGGVIPLAMTMGRTGVDNSRFFAVFRDLSQIRKSETDLFTARRQAERAQAARTDAVSRIHHDIRAPLNAIVGFADVMIEERFGPIGNERYAAYLKDIRASAERVLAIVGDMLDLSRIEAGKLDLAFSGHNLNAVIEQCVAALQPQANRERIIIRTSLAHALPVVLADSRMLTQIVTNLVTGSIRLSNPGGQVIVSTALSERGEAMLRVRDTGETMNERDITVATDPYATISPDHGGADRAGVNLSLTKALAEANRAQFHIRTGQMAGTLFEVIFSSGAAAA